MCLVLYVDQTPKMTEEVVDLFASSEYHLIVFNNNKEAYDYCKRKTPEVVFLKDTFEIYSGASYGKMIKRKNYNICVILIGEKIIVEQVVKALNNLVNHYISQEYGAEGILAYTRAAVRENRLYMGDKGIIKVAKDVYLKKNVCELVIGGTTTRLTVKQYVILLLLVDNVSIVVRQKRLLLEAWGTDCESNIQGLRKVINRCRKILKPASHVEIVTYWQMGYMLKVHDGKETNPLDEYEKCQNALNENLYE